MPYFMGMEMTHFFIMVAMLAILLNIPVLKLLIDCVIVACIVKANL